MLSREQAYALMDKIVATSRFEVVISMDYLDLGLTRFANSEIHQNMASLDTQVSITLFDGEKMATSVTNVLSESAVLAALNAAELKLPLLQPSGMFFEPLKNMEAIEVEDYDDSFNQTWGIEQRADAISEEIGKLPEGYIASGAFEVKHTAYAWGNSHGVRRFVNGSQAHLEVMVTYPDGASGFADILVPYAKELSVADAFQFAYDKAVAGLNAVAIEPGTYTVVLEPPAVSDLMSYLGYIGANSKFHIDGLSPFVGQLGQIVASDAFTLEDWSQGPGMIGLPFDSEGYPRQRLSIIENGVFKGIAYDTVTATKQGVKTTGHSTGYRGEGGIPLNLVIKRGNESLADLVKGVNRGLLVSRFHYMNIVDPTTGMLTALTRDGLFVIEDGKVTKAVKNLRFTDALPRILKAITGIGDERSILPSFFGSNCVSSLRVEGFTFTCGTSIEG